MTAATSRAIATAPLVLYGQTFQSRLLLGTSRYPSPSVLKAAVQRAKPAMLTASLRRQNVSDPDTSNRFWELLRELEVPVLPNTAGCHSVQEVITTAQMAREVFATPWIKLELIGDDYTLQPDTLNLVDAAQRLIKDGFKVLPYCTDDLVSAQRLVDAGCRILMPWAAPIGSGLGLLNPWALRTLRARLPHITLIVDAGLGAPSHATAAMELGMDAVLLNSAVSQSHNPVGMASAFRHAVQGGREGILSGLMPSSDMAVATTPVGGQPFVLL